MLKIPDGCFSRGVCRVNNALELEQAAGGLFEQSSILIAQEYLFTEFDWRIGVFGGQPVFACRYYMSRGHWQVYKHGPSRDGGSPWTRAGSYDTLSVDEVPGDVLELALRSAAAIGDGFYGVDLKVARGRAVVIEVNDNPNVDAGVEDAHLGADVYRRVMAEFARRLDARAAEAT